MPDSNIIQIDQNLFETKLDGSARKVAHFGSWPSMER